MAAGEELLDLGQDLVGIGEPGRVVAAVDLEQPRTGDVVDDVPAAPAPESTSSRAWMTRVGALIVGRIGRTSIRNIASSAARAIPGLALMRSTIASWRIDRTDGSRALHASPLPHAETAARPTSLQAGELLHRGRVVVTQLAHEARPQLGRIAVQVVPAVDEGECAKVPVRINARVRSGRVAAKKMDAGPPSLAPKSTALSKPTASMTASISAARSSSVRTFGTGSDSPPRPCRTKGRDRTWRAARRRPRIRAWSSTARRGWRTIRRRRDRSARPRTPDTPG